MKFNKISATFILIFVFIVSGCARQNLLFPGALNASAIGPNVMAVQVGNCGPDGYTNEPCTSVTICTPGTSTCQTIPNVLVDTGSSGLRIFASAISISLSQETDSQGHSIAECTSFVSANDWGPVQVADVHLGGETAKSLPIHVMNSNFAKVPSTCTSPETGPSVAGYNGILGVGLFSQDCGDECVTNVNNQTYYACTGTTCTNITMSLQKQVSNPIAFLPLDNNGVILQLPAVSSSGAPSVTGTLTFGIGTQANNTPSGVTAYSADGNGHFITIFNSSTPTGGFISSTYSGSFIDSGSNAFFFPAPSSLTTCPTTGAVNGFYCPPTPVSFSATQKGSNSSPQNVVGFQIMNAENALFSSNNVFNNIGGTMSGVFVWGLPFFLGRTVYVGIEGTSSSLGTGPYWAY